MSKTSRQRRQKKEQQRQRERAPRDAGNERRQSPGRGPELVTELIAKAMRALADAALDRYTHYVDQLAADRGAGWSQVVSAQLVDFLRSRVTAAWNGGWQPAELARHVGRERSAAHASMAADMIAGEMRHYPAAAVDPRWAAQVAALTTAAPMAHEAEYLGAWRAAVAEMDPTAAVATALETLTVLLELRVLEKLMPKPGSPAKRHPAPATAPSQADDRMLSKIRALLAKAESTEFAEEAEALSARAQELMAKYSIDHALLAAEAGEREEPGGRRIAVDNPYEGPKATLLNTVAEANRCRAIWAKDIGLVTIVGFPADLDVVELLFTSLLVQANTAMMRAGGKKDEFGRSRTRAFRQSFLISYAIRIGERLAEAATHAEQEAVAEWEAGSATRPNVADAAVGSVAAGVGTDLVPFLAARREAVDDTVDELFGARLTKGRASRVTDAEGWVSGRAAADLATLHNREAVPR
jgi:Protein of unknown function (DUF2786)